MSGPALAVRLKSAARGCDCSLPVADAAVVWGHEVMAQDGEPELFEVASG